MPPTDDDRPPRPGFTTARLDEAVRRIDHLQLDLERDEEVRKQLEAHTKDLADLRSTIRVLKVLGSIAIVIFSVVGGLALKALYGSGLDTGTVRTTLQYMERLREEDRGTIRENREAIRAVEREVLSLKKLNP